MDPVLNVVEGEEEFVLLSVRFEVLAPLSWSDAKSSALQEEAKAAIVGAEKWLHDQLKRIDSELELVRA